MGNTVTTAIADRLGRGPGADDFATFAAAHPELLGPSRVLLGGYYSPETLDGEHARHGFLLPERLPEHG